MTDRVGPAGAARPLKILAVAFVFPKPDQNGGGLLTHRLLTMLAAEHQVTLLTFLESNELCRDDDPGEIARYQAMYRRANIRLIEGFSTIGLRRALLSELYDVVLFEFWTCAREGVDLVQRHQPWAKVIIETVDINFRREAAAAQMGLMDPALAASNQAAELATYRQAAALICISEEDSRALHEWPDLGRRVVIPHMVEPVDRPPLNRGAELLFIGGFAHAPNPDGLLWFVREIWPEIRKLVPSAQLRVVGSHPTAEVLALGAVGGIDVVGWVPDITPLCDRAALMIAPLRFGGGVKIKVVEAMARGLPVVTTQVGAQGLDVKSGEHLIIAQDEAEFARQVSELLYDPVLAERIGRNGRDYVAATCSLAATKQRLVALLDTLVDQGRPQAPPPKWLLQSALSKARIVLGRIKRQVQGKGR